MSYATAWPYYPLHSYDTAAQILVFPPRFIPTNETLLQATFSYHPDDYSLIISDTEITISGRWLGFQPTTFVYDRTTGRHISFEWYGNQNNYGLFEFIDENERTSFPISISSTTDTSDGDDSPVLWEYVILPLFIILPILRRKKPIIDM
jgi:hypothetical protein